jgi:hypothetical protein
MRNCIVVKQVTLKEVMLQKAIKDILVTHGEMTIENAISIAKLIVIETDRVIRDNSNVLESVMEIVNR